MGVGITAEAAQAQQAAAVAAAQRAAGVVTFTVDDGDGNSHTYICTLHGTEDGQNVVWALVALGGEPLGALLQGAAGKLVAEGSSIGDVLASDASDVVKSIDWSGVGRDIAASVARTNMPELTRLILRHTHRDGAQLADKMAFNAAYRANYGELMRALWEVIGANRFLPF